MAPKKNTIFNCFLLVWARAAGIIKREKLPATASLETIGRTIFKIENAQAACKASAELTTHGVVVTRQAIWLKRILLAVIHSEYCFACPIKRREDGGE